MCPPALRVKRGQASSRNRVAKHLATCRITPMLCACQISRRPAAALPPGGGLEDWGPDSKWCGGVESRQPQRAACLFVTPRLVLCVTIQYVTAHARNCRCARPQAQHARKKPDDPSAHLTSRICCWLRSCVAVERSPQFVHVVSQKRPRGRIEIEVEVRSASKQLILSCLHDDSPVVGLSAAG